MCSSVFPETYISPSFSELWETFDVSDLLSNEADVRFFDKWLEDFYPGVFDSLYFECTRSDTEYVRQLNFCLDECPGNEETYLSKFAVSPIYILKCASVYLKEIHSVNMSVEESGCTYILRFS